jgi:hypothetical protein
MTTDLLLAAPAEAVVALLPDIDDHRLSVDEASARIATNPELMPLAIDAARFPGGAVYWADLSGRGQQEWQLVYDIEAAVQADAVGDRFVSPLAIFDRPPPSDSHQPTGFIFHMSRCGSTLVSRSLAQSPRHLVRSQPGALRDGIWTALTAGWTAGPTAGPTAEGEPESGALTQFRNLIGYLLRTANEPVDGAFIKFYSENVLFLDLVQAAFPDVPSLFLFRNPVEVMASVGRNGTGMLAARGTKRAAWVAGLSTEDEQQLDDVAYLIACYRRYLTTVLGEPGADGSGRGRTGVTLLDHRHLRAEHFPTIVADAFGYQLPPRDLEPILDQFSRHAKSPSDKPATYTDDSEAKRRALSPEDRARVEQALGPLVEQARTRAWRPADPTPDNSTPGSSVP